MKRLFPLILILLLLPLGCLENHPVGAPDSAGISVYFSPRGGCTKALIRAFNKAEKSIDAAIYAFTSRKIAKALIDAKNRGVKVRVIIDIGTARSKHCMGPLLERAGIPVRYKKGSGGGLMHNKYAVIDGRTVVTGSFNWTNSAEKRNDENLVVITNSPATAKRYERNFEKLWRLAELSN